MMQKMKINFVILIKFDRLASEKFLKNPGNNSKGVCTNPECYHIIVFVYVHEHWKS